MRYHRNAQTLPIQPHPWGARILGHRTNHDRWAMAAPCAFLLTLGSYRNAQFDKTLGTTFYFVLRLDRSHTQIAYGRGNPLKLLAGFSFP